MSVNFSDTTPAAPGGHTNVAWQKDGSGNVSANIITPTASVLTTKGDVMGYSTTPARIPIGSDGQVLTADSGQTLGLKWATGGGGGGASITIGALASLPGSGTTAGDTYECTDSPYRFVWTGSIWQAFFSGYPVVKPVLANFTQVNCASNVTFATAQGGIAMQVTSTGGDNARVLQVTAALPATPYYIDAAFCCHGSTPIWGAGPGVTDGTKITAAVVGWESGVNWVKRIQMNNPTSFNNNAVAGSQTLLGPLVWFRIYDDGVNLTYYISTNGYQWEQMTQEGRTAFLTPANACFMVNNVNVGGGGVGAHLVHFAVHG